jgi:hypothetical protein
MGSHLKGAHRTFFQNGEHLIQSVGMMFFQFLYSASAIVNQTAVPGKNKIHL